MLGQWHYLERTTILTKIISYSLLLPGVPWNGVMETHHMLALEHQNDGIQNKG